MRVDAQAKEAGPGPSGQSSPCCPKFLARQHCKHARRRPMIYVTGPWSVRAHGPRDAPAAARACAPAAARACLALGSSSVRDARTCSDERRNACVPQAESDSAARACLPQVRRRRTWGRRGTDRACAARGHKAAGASRQISRLGPAGETPRHLVCLRACVIQIKSLTNKTHVAQNLASE